MDTDNPAIYLALVPEKTLYLIIILNQKRSGQKLFLVNGKAKSIVFFLFFSGDKNSIQCENFQIFVKQQK